MALIDGNYVLVKTENMPYEIEVTENPVEKGIPLTDHTERKTQQLTLDCLIVDRENGVKAKDTLEELQKIQQDAKIVKFVGRNIFNGIIQKIDKTDSNEVANGFTCSIEMKEIRIAKSPFRPDLLQAAINAGLQQLAKQNEAKPVYHTVVRGDCLINIAKKYGTTLDWIIKHNKIPSGNPNLIYPGEKYLVKEGSSSAAIVNQSLRWLSVAEEINRRSGSSTKTTKTKKIILTSGGGGSNSFGKGSGGGFR